MLHQIVMPDGPLNADIAFVGEAPGQTETVSGRGFTGASGKLLWTIAGAFGIMRDFAYVSNVIKTRPPGDDVSKFISFDRGKVNKTQTYNEAVAILSQELEQLERVKVIVAVGNVALYALTGKVGITKWRGSILSSTLHGIEGKKVIPIIHPAAAMRQYTFTHMIRLDMSRIVEEMKFPEVRLPLRNLLVAPSFLEAIGFLAEIKRLPITAFDIEVLNNELSCISFAPDEVRSMSIPFICGGADYFTVDQELEVIRSIAQILQNPNIKKVGQNLAFDSTFMFMKYGIVVDNIEDTMVGQAIAFPDYPKGLDFITSVYTKEPYYKDEGKRWFKIGGNEREFWGYNAKDSVVCTESFPKIWDNLNNLGNVKTYDEQRDLIPSLTYMQARGIKVDTKGLKEEQERVGKEIDLLSAKLDKIVGRPINHNSPKQLQAYFYIEKKEKPYVSRKTGTPTTDETALKRLSRKGYSEAGVILDLRHLSKLKGTYLDVTLDADSRLRCSFNPVGTAQGRLSSSETIFGTGTNMQNLPEEFRRFLVADDNCLMFNVDLSQAENRTVAYIAPEPNMIRAFEEKIDVHSLTGSLISGLPIEEVARQDKENIPCPLGGGQFTWRFWGKKANHGLNYDLGYRAFSLLYEIPDSDGRFIVDRYHKAYPGVRQYHAWVRHKLSETRTLTNPFGRSRLFTERWGDELFKVAYSFIPQSTVADIINRRGLNYLYYNQDLFKPVDLLLQVHDSILFQMDTSLYSYEQMAEVLLTLIKNLEQPIKWGSREFVIPASTAVGLCFAKKKMIEVETHGQTVEGLARCISDVHRQLRATVHIQTLDRPMYDISVPSQEVCAQLWNPNVLP